MVFTDTHTHLYLDEFSNDIDIVIENAFSSNVKRLFFPAINSKYSSSMFNLQKKYPENIFLMSGLHPCYVGKDFSDEISLVQNILKNNHIVAIGEIGIDLYWDKSNLSMQTKAFEMQIEIANNNHLPIVIHCRESFDEIYNVLINNKPLNGGVFHCFSGDLEQANKIIELDMKLGIGGVVTFKNGKIDKFLNQIDIKNIVLETDSPYLSPAPFRGNRNQSANIKIIAEKLCDIYNLSLNEIAKITTHNSKEVFKV
ncbi:MAG: TatD family deoxyribonuclease [Bacteroidetes bacterium]|nr:MAG: TatD family deoxyribonuclease [Bacteroidota bacterium]